MEDNIISLKLFWKFTINYGTYVRKNKLNGLESWQLLKKMFGTVNKSYDLNLENLEELRKKVDYKEIGKEDENAKLTVDGTEMSNDIEHDHFFVQLFRLPKVNNKDGKLQFLKLMQIAYNIGQFKAENYDKSVAHFFKKHKMRKLRTYVK
uniref:Uncharacterized protein n=1 Tax=viral metagenome TaxID=1070528 RepID=A0A6C0EFP6_9ZZZZ